MRTFTVHRHQQTVNSRKRGRESANLSTMSTEAGEALNNIMKEDEEMEVDINLSPIAARLRSR